MFAGIFAALAGYERELMHERAAAARAAARARGRHTAARRSSPKPRADRSVRCAGTGSRSRSWYAATASPGPPSTAPSTPPIRTDTWAEDAVVQQPVGRLPWRHVTVLLDKLDDQAQRDWYAAAAVPPPSGSCSAQGATTMSRATPSPRQPPARRRQLHLRRPTRAGSRAAPTDEQPDAVIAAATHHRYGRRPPPANRRHRLTVLSRTPDSGPHRPIRAARPVTRRA
jgi:hypothetical protein